jgi:hypothetical protein
MTVLHSRELAPFVPLELQRPNRAAEFFLFRDPP